MTKKPDLKLVKSDVDEASDDLTLPIPKPMMKEPPEGDWLSPLESGTEFKCRDKTGRTPSWLVMEYTHMGKLKGDVLLCPTVSLQDARSWFWVEPIRFCQAWEFRGVIEEPNPEVSEGSDDEQSEE